MEDMTHLREDDVDQGYEALQDDQYGALVLHLSYIQICVQGHVTFVYCATVF